MSVTLSQAIGYEQAMKFLLENRTVTGEEAKSLGVVSQVVPDEQLFGLVNKFISNHR